MTGLETDLRALWAWLWPWLAVLAILAAIVAPGLP